MSDGQDALVREIREFLEKHAKTSGSFDPECDDPEERFNGPDSMLLHVAANALEADEDFPYVHSEWSSGCYTPYGDSVARAWHDDLVKRVNELRPSLGKVVGRF